MELLEKCTQKISKSKLHLLHCFTGLLLGSISVYYCYNVKFPYSATATLVLVLMVLFPFLSTIKNGRWKFDPFEPLTLVLLGILVYFIFPAIDLIFFGGLIDPSINVSHYKTLTVQDDYFLARVISVCGLKHDLVQVWPSFSVGQEKWGLGSDKLWVKSSQMIGSHSGVTIE